MDIAFSWEKPSDYTTKYDLKLYDADGNAIQTIVVASTGSTPSQLIGPGTTLFLEAPDATYVTSQIQLMPGYTYTWKVRVSSDGPIYSPYSEVRTFTVDDAEAALAPITVTIPEIIVPAPEVTVEPTPITVAPPEVTVEVTPAPASATAAAPPVPNWALLTIIIIGAVLLIGVIVLIVRTRRVA